VVFGLDIDLGGKRGRKISSMEDDLDSWSCELRIGHLARAFSPLRAGSALWDDIEIEGKADSSASLRNDDLDRDESNGKGKMGGPSLRSE
jgi:hypothetical protein